MDNELLLSLIEAIAKLNQQQKDLDADNIGITKELNDFESEYAKETKLLQKQIDAVSITIDRLVREAISTIKQPTSGVDGKDGQDYDETVAKALLKAEINKLVKQRNLETEKIKSELLRVVSEIEVPKARDGKNASDLQVENAVRDWFDANPIQNEPTQEAILKAVAEHKQDNVAQMFDVGVSVVDMKIVAGYIVITFSNGETKKIKLPINSQKTITTGGGASTPQYILDYVAGDSLKSMYNSAYKASSGFIIRESGKIARVEIYDDDAQTKKLFTKELIRVDGKITQIVITNELSGATFTKVLHRDVDGNIEKYNDEVA